MRTPSPFISRFLPLLFIAPFSAISLAQCPHAGNGVGSIPYPPGGPYQGVSFRVWAPHASAVSVKDPASGRSVALVQQGSTGYWCLDVPGVGINQRYDYVITTPGFGTVTRRDPNARVLSLHPAVLHPRHHARRRQDVIRAFGPRKWKE